jgi:UDP-N-acetylmuramyl pentapeptide synthase
MRELGDATDIEHQVLINNAITKAHHLIVIGEYCINAALRIQSDTISIAASHEQCAEQLRTLSKTDDIVLIKGSRGMRMEKVIELFNL